MGGLFTYRERCDRQSFARQEICGLSLLLQAHDRPVAYTDDVLQLHDKMMGLEDTISEERAR